jgi:hypothetical protein
MALDFEHKGTVGLALMLIGTLAFVPALFPNAGGVASYLVLPAVVVLTVGTYLVGTNIEGRPV